MARSTNIGKAGSPPARQTPPWRFLAFLAISIGAAVAIAPSLGWREGVMAGFDIGAIVFILFCLPMLSSEAAAMRRRATLTDPSRVLRLAITVVVSVVIMVAVASELMQTGQRQAITIALIFVTLPLSWLFSTIVYALHYAHLFYASDAGGADRGGIEFPGTKEPDYWDFLYFSACLGMTFQTSDTDITSGRIRRIVMVHSLAAFIFNLGVIAFSINVLGGGR